MAQDQSIDTQPLQGVKREPRSDDVDSGTSEMERAMAATLAQMDKNLEAVAPTTSTEEEKKPILAEDYEAELKKRQADKFRELLNFKV